MNGSPNINHWYERVHNISSRRRGVQSLAHFMQQCGRAGRDGEDAECITFHRAQDAQEIRPLGSVGALGRWVMGIHGGFTGFN